MPSTLKIERPVRSSAGTSSVYSAYPSPLPDVTSRGHVPRILITFFHSCLNSLTRSKCPLCRQRFDPRSLVKLHIDSDEAHSPSHAPEPAVETSDVLEARGFQERIAAAANEGTTEQGVRQLIDECRAFLSQQPRNNVCLYISSSLFFC